MDDAANGEGASAPAFNIAAPGAQPVAAAAPSSLPAAADPAPVAASAPWVKLINDVDGVGRSGRVVRASAARVQPWIDAGDAALATETELALATPTHTIILED